MFWNTMTLVCRHCNGVLRRIMGNIGSWTSHQIQKLRVAHAPRTVSPPPRVCDHNIHHGARVMHVPWCMPGSLTSGFLWCRWQGKRSRHSRRMHNPQFYVSGKRPMDTVAVIQFKVFPSPVNACGHVCRELEQLKRLRSEETLRCPVIAHTMDSYWIPIQNKTKSKLRI